MEGGYGGGMGVGWLWVVGGCGWWVWVWVWGGCGGAHARVLRGGVEKYGMGVGCGYE